MFTISPGSSLINLWGALHLFSDCGVETSSPSLLVPRLEGGVGSSVVNELTATTLDVCFNEVGVAVSTVAVFCGDEEAAVLDVFSVGRNNVAFGVAIAPSSSSELSPSL